MSDSNEKSACTPVPIKRTNFNDSAVIPYNCTIDDIYRAMNEFVEFLAFINTQLYTREIPRMETMLMPANFSSMVSEFMVTTIPKYCTTLVKNRYHNGHPDLIPTDQFEDNAVQHSQIGIEVKASRYKKGWQGHNAEDVWLMVFVFDSNRPTDASKDINPKPFKFLRVVGAQLTKEDWKFAGRSSTSRRTITASVKKSGFEKLSQNWLYEAD